MATLEFSADRNALFAAIHKIQGVVDRKSTSNILAHILVESLPGNEKVRLLGTDYDVTILAEVSAKVTKPGSAAINGKSLFDIVKNLDSGEVTLKALPNDWIDLKAGRSAFKLAGISPADFPEAKLPEIGAWLELPRVAVRDLFEKTAFSMSSDETRMNLNGVFFRVNPSTGEMQGVSTDGHRLSVAVAECPKSFGAEVSCIVHKKGVTEIKRLLDSADEKVRIGFGKGAVLFAGEGATYVVRQIEDAFPDFRRVIPQGETPVVTVSREKLARAVKKIAILTNSKTYVVKLSLAGGLISVSASNPDYGEGRDEVDAEYSGPALGVGFNYTYLLDVLSALRGEAVEIRVADEFSPAVVTSPSEPGAVFVVMPMRV